MIQDSIPSQLDDKLCRWKITLKNSQRRMPLKTSRKARDASLQPVARVHVQWARKETQAVRGVAQLIHDSTIEGGIRIAIRKNCTFRKHASRWSRTE